jgi:hypothetical protein
MTSAHSGNEGVVIPSYATLLSSLEECNDTIRARLRENPDVSCWDPGNLQEEQQGFSNLMMECFWAARTDGVKLSPKKIKQGLGEHH